jgi:hypothetical protein
MATWLEDIQQALANLGGVAPLDQLYRELKRLRGSSVTPKWRTTVRGIILKRSSDSTSFRGPHDLFYSVEGLGSGVWGLRASLKPTPAASDLQEPKTPQRSLAQTYRVIRDTELTRKLKAFHKNACQLCGKVLRLNNGESYSEAHHIQPLGSPHDGPDVAANIIVLCPNDHVLLDYGAVRLDLARLRTVQGHAIGTTYVDYHNKSIFTGRSKKVRSNNRIHADARKSGARG